MVAKIITGKNISGAVRYNEKKVAEGKAALLYACRFPTEQLPITAKIERFRLLTEQNRRSKTNAIHISLNFAPSEKPDKYTLLEVADAYMKGIGFESQPYLLYQHSDAAHPHVHIVTTNIKDGGKAIPLHNIGGKQSETARKKIEIQFGLIPAESQKKAQTELKPLQEEIIYGRDETKAAVSKVVRSVVRDYKFTSLEELNAALACYNVAAYRGEKGTRMYERKGLTYSVLNQNGERIGVPIKASAIYSRPTLNHLEKKFEANTERRKPYRDRLKNIINDTLEGNHLNDKEAFAAALKDKNISVIFRENDQMVYGITFIDHEAKTVFNGSALGKDFGASAILKRIGRDGIQTRYERTANRKGAEMAIRDTNFSRGMTGAISDLYAKGFRIRAEDDASGRLNYFIGHYSTNLENYTPLNNRLSAYFQVNGLSHRICESLNKKAVEILEALGGKGLSFTTDFLDYITGLLASEQAITHAQQNQYDRKKKRRKLNW